jgi:hypothetical protein
MVMIYATTIAAAVSAVFATYRPSMWSGLIAALLNGLAAWAVIASIPPHH